MASRKAPKETADSQSPSAPVAKMGTAAIIVESPTKTRTIKGYLGGNFNVVSSMGHVRDLPKKELGVTIEEDFSPKYVSIPEKRDTLRKLKNAIEQADTVYLATDPDREGEAIAWHVAEALKLKKAQRIEFNEITKSAVTKALEHPRPIDMNRVNAQQARRVLDRLVGYKLSPLLWKKVTKGLSAGRVQSVAVRLICDREREIQAFTSVEYWSITARLQPEQAADSSSPDKDCFLAKLDRRDGEKIGIENEEQANQLLEALHGAEYVVASVKQQEKRRNPVPPFITSTLQQEAVKKLGFSSKKTMMLAQQLYEGIDLGDQGTVGLITYMRTDSTRVAAEAQTEARDLIGTRYGDAYLPERPPVYKSRKDAQEAHEAVRPTAAARVPDSMKGFLTADQDKLYELIWMRFVASQMCPAIMDTVSVDIAAGPYTFRASGSTIKFAGFLAAYQEAKDEDKQEEDEDAEGLLPPLEEGQALNLRELLPKQHFTQPPPRYTEATLVKTLEENGIGRPSTYAPIISTIVERGYVKLETRRFSPTELGFIVNDKLVEHFSDVMEVGFTAGMEEELDDIEEGKRNWVEVLNGFWQPFATDLEKATAEMDKVGGQETGETCPNCERPMVVRYSKLGFFLGCSGYPECKTILQIEPPSEMESTEEEGEKGNESAGGDTQPAEAACPDCGAPMQLRQSRTGRFYGCTKYPECRGTMPYTAGSGEARAPREKKPPELTDKECPKCGEPMVVRQSRRGQFYGCSTYPKCRGTMPLEGESAGGASPGGKEPEVSDQTCPKCGSPMLVKVGKFGKFLGCSAYPKCRTIVNIETPPEPLAKCTKPGCEGDVVQRKFRKGGRFGVFYGCTRYPDCDFSIWDKPTGEVCSQCGSLIVEKTARGQQTSTVQCSNEDCSGV